MKKIAGMVAVALTFSVATALAQTNKPDATTAPSAGNSGAGIAGSPGNKSGPAASPGTTTGSAAQPNPTVQQQDAAKVKGLPGNKSGPSAKSPARQ